MGLSGNDYGVNVRASGLGADYIALRIAKGGPLCDGMELGKTPSNCNDLIGYSGEIVAAQVRRRKTANCGLDALVAPRPREAKGKLHRVVGKLKMRE